MPEPNRKPKRSDQRPDRQTSGPTPPRKPQNMKMSRGMMGWLLLGGLAVLLVVLLTSAQNQADEISPKQFMEKVKARKFSDPLPNGQPRVTVEHRRVVGIVKEGASGEPATPGREKRYFFAIHPQDTGYYIEQLAAEGHHCTTKELRIASNRPNGELSTVQPIGRSSGNG